MRFGQLLPPQRRTIASHSRVEVNIDDRQGAGDEVLAEHVGGRSVVVAVPTQLRGPE
jgi:hypothetical protein